MTLLSELLMINISNQMDSLETINLIDFYNAKLPFIFETHSHLEQHLLNIMNPLKTFSTMNTFDSKALTQTLLTLPFL